MNITMTCIDGVTMAAPGVAVATDEVTSDTTRSADRRDAGAAESADLLEPPDASRATCKPVVDHVHRLRT